MISYDEVTVVGKANKDIFWKEKRNKNKQSLKI